MQLIDIKTNKMSVLKLMTIVLTVRLIYSSFPTVLANSSLEFETAATIEEGARSFLEDITNAADKNGIEVKVNQLDPRLRLRKCANDLGLRFPTGSHRTGKVTVAVSCDFPVVWKVFVSASLYEYANIVVARKTISPRSVITERDIVLERMNISKLRKNAIFDLNQVVGSASKRQIRTGAVVFEDSICMVCKGANVQVVAKNEHFSINMDGTALADAAIGEMTRIRNNKSKRSFSAKVVGRNRLEISLRP